jgi:hypothetical protein
MGQGPMTGARRGWCGGALRAETPPQAPGRGHGHGGGWRRRYGFYATGLPGWQRAQMGRPDPNIGFSSAPTKEQELASLKQQAASLEQTLGELESRIRELDTQAGSDKGHP